MEHWFNGQSATVQSLLLEPLIETTLALAHEAALPFFPVFGLFMRRESQFWNILQSLKASPFEVVDLQSQRLSNCKSTVRVIPCFLSKHNNGAAIWNHATSCSVPMPQHPLSQSAKSLTLALPRNCPFTCLEVG
jgi:hypothetical protein